MKRIWRQQVHWLIVATTRDTVEENTSKWPPEGRRDFDSSSEHVCDNQHASADDICRRIDQLQVNATQASVGLHFNLVILNNAENSKLLHSNEASIWRLIRRLMKYDSLGVVYADIGKFSKEFIALTGALPLSSAFTDSVVWKGPLRTSNHMACTVTISAQDNTVEKAKLFKHEFMHKAYFIDVMPTQEKLALGSPLSRHISQTKLSRTSSMTVLSAGNLKPDTQDLPMKFVLRCTGDTFSVIIAQVDAILPKCSWMLVQIQFHEILYSSSKLRDYSSKSITPVSVKDINGPQVIIWRSDDDCRGMILHDSEHHQTQHFLSALQVDCDARTEFANALVDNLKLEVQKFMSDHSETSANLLVTGCVIPAKHIGSMQNTSAFASDAFTSKLHQLFKVGNEPHSLIDYEALDFKVGTVNHSFSIESGPEAEQDLHVGYSLLSKTLMNHKFDFTYPFESNSVKPSNRNMRSKPTARQDLLESSQPQPTVDHSAKEEHVKRPAKLSSFALAKKRRKQEKAA